MTPLEIAQKYVYGEHDALTDNQEIIDMTEDIKQAISEQLLLHNVSQQRELLNTFITEYNKGATDSDEIIKSISDDIIESIL